MRLAAWLESNVDLSDAAVATLQQLGQSQDPSAVWGRKFVEQGAITETQLVQGLAEEFHCEAVFSPEEFTVDPDLIQDLPVEFARQMVMLPVRIKSKVVVLTSHPAQTLQDTQWTLLLGISAPPVVAPQSVILDSIDQCYLGGGESTVSLVEGLHSTDESDQELAQSGSSDLLQNSELGPAAQFVNLVLLEALQADASDIHIEPFGKTLKIRFRIDGQLYEHTSPPKHLEAALISRLKIMGKLDIAEKRLPQDGMTKVVVGKREIDVRISTVPVAAGERMVLRLLRHDAALRSLTELGMQGRVLELFKHMIMQPHGVIWVTGPTGSGKTTTLYAAIAELNTQRKNVMTIEDPVEYRIPEIGQISVHPKIGLTFAQGLRHILRQDPDVILVGETRDAETAEIVVQSSLTGHLVFSTLHTNNAISSVSRLVDMGVEPFMVAESSRGAVAQRLVRKLCSSCRELVAADDPIWGRIPKVMEGLKSLPVYCAKGCSSCREGYRGRVALYEIIEINEALQEGIRSGLSSTELTKIATAQGSVRLIDDGLEKIEQGLTSIDEVLTVTGL